MRHEESHLQQACVRWFRLQYPQHAQLLIAVPNGVRTSATQGRILKAEGMLAGVADLLLLLPRHGYGCLCIALDRLPIDYELVGWSEIDRYAIQAHNALYPQWADRNYGDIPLTVEILERNGFVKNVWNIYTAPTCCLSVERVKGYFFLRLGTFQLCEIKYVHELQNFLRDFKTNKEITL